MTDVYGIYLEVIDKANKEEGGYLPVDLYNRYSAVASRFVFNDYIARLQDPTTSRVEKQKLLDRLLPFITMQEVQAIGGFADVPADYAYFSSGRGYFDNGDSIIQLNALYSKLCLAEEDPTIDPVKVQAEINAVVTNPKLVTVTLLDNEQIGKRLNSYIPGKAPSLKNQ